MFSDQVKLNIRGTLEQLCFCIDTFLETGEQYNMEDILANCKIAADDSGKEHYETFVCNYRDLREDYLGITRNAVEIISGKSKKPNYIKSFFSGAFYGAVISVVLTLDLRIAAVLGVLLGSAFAISNYLAYSKYASGPTKVTPEERKAKWQLESYKGEFEAKKEGLIKDTLHELIK